MRDRTLNSMRSLVAEVIRITEEAESECEWAPEEEHAVLVSPRKPQRSPRGGSSAPDKENSVRGEKKGQVCRASAVLQQVPQERALEPPRESAKISFVGGASGRRSVLGSKVVEKEQQAKTRNSGHDRIATNNLCKIVSPLSYKTLSSAAKCTPQ